MPGIYNKKRYIDEYAKLAQINNNRDTFDALHYGTTGAGIGAAVANNIDLLNKVGFSVPQSAIETFGNVGSKISPVTTVLGGALSGANLVNDIVENVKDKRVDFNDAMRIADDATGVASAAASFIPGIGVPLSLGLTIGEGLVTGGIKAAHAVEEEKKKEGVKHLDFNTWAKTSMDAIFPHWMTTDFKVLAKEAKIKKTERKAQKKADKAAWKKMSGKEKAQRVFFG
jgi:hypothetical protein